MITTRRQVIDTQEKTDGYDNRPLARVMVPEETVQEQPALFREIETERPVQYEQARPAARIFEPIVTPAATRVTAGKSDKEDFMPVIAAEQDIREKNSERMKLDAKAKMLLCIYLAAAFILSMVVLATGLAITGAGRDVAALESRLSASNAIVAEQNETLTLLSNDTFLTGRAAELGMVKTEGATEIDMIEVVDPVTYEPRSNAFDKLCDFLSTVFGG